MLPSFSSHHVGLPTLQCSKRVLNQVSQTNNYGISHASCGLSTPPMLSANCMTAPRNKPAAPLNNFKAINYAWKLKPKQLPVFVPCIFASCSITAHWWAHIAWLGPKFIVQWVERGKKLRAGDSSAFPAWRAQSAASWTSPAHLSPEFKRLFFLDCYMNIINECRRFRKNSY